MRGCAQRIRSENYGDTVHLRVVVTGALDIPHNIHDRHACEFDSLLLAVLALL